MDEIQFSSLGDLSIEIVGGTSNSSDVHFREEQVAFSPTLSEVFASRRDNQTNLVPNNINITGISDPKEKDEENFLKQRKIQDESKRLLMKGTDPQEVLQFLRRNLIEVDPTIIQNIRDSVGYLGTIYIDRSAFSRCDDTINFIRNNKGRCTAEYLLPGPGCKGCRTVFNERCQRTGLKLAQSGIDKSPEALEKQIARLKSLGRIRYDKEIKSEQGFIAALFEKDVPQVKVYNAPAREEKPGSTYRQIIREFNTAAANKNEQIKTAAEKIKENRIIKPILRDIQAQIFKGARGPLLKDNIRRKGYSSEQLSICKPFIVELINDPAIITKLKIDPNIFNDCKHVKKYCDEANIHPPFIKVTPSCETSCVQNVNGTCTLLKSKIIRENSEIPAPIIINQIEELLMRHQITPDQGTKYKDMERHEKLSGLRAALSAVEFNTGKMEDHKDNSGGDFNNFCSKINLDRKADVYSFIANELKKGRCISQLFDVLTQYSDAERLIYEAIYSLPIISAESFDDCAVNRYSFQPGALLVKSVKCEGCPNATGLHCNKQGVPFASEISASLSTQDSQDTLEIKTFFADRPMDVELDNKTQAEKPLEIEFSPEIGDIEAASYEKNDDPGFQKYYNTHKSIKVSLNEAYKETPVQEIETSGAASWDLTSFLQ